MKIAALVSSKPGISTTLVGEQVIKALEGRGHEVVAIPVDTTKGFGGAAGLPVLSLVEGRIGALIEQIRFLHPTRIVSVMLANWEEYDLSFQLGYLARFSQARIGGVPITHVSHSWHSDAEMRKTIREYLAPTVGRAIQSRMKVVHFGIEHGFGSGENHPDRLIVPYNRVNQTQKNVRLHASITRLYMQWAATKGYEPRTTFLYADGFGPDQKDFAFDREVYDFCHQPPDRAMFKTLISNAGMFLSTSMFESFGIYYLELLRSGVVGLFLDRPWVRLLLPNYPYVGFASELPAMMAHVRENFSGAQHMINSAIIPYIDAHYRLEQFVAGIEGELILPS